MRKGSYNGADSEKVGNKTMTVASNFKFQNLQRLNTIVGQVSQRNNKQIVMRSGKAGMSDKVLDMIKNRIKTNYDKLYENYDQNKKTILKQIQHVQTNMSSENAINKGFQNVIKQKSNYDKAKSQLEAKQKKLKKLIQIRDQLKGVTDQNKEVAQIVTEKCSLYQNLQSYRQMLDYQTCVLNNMKADRKNIKLWLKQMYDKTLADQQFKKQRIKKLENINHNKKAMIKRIEQNLKKQQTCQIPQNLAEQLQRKLQEYEGKQIYENIIKHENIISQQLKRQYEEQEAREKEETRRQRLLKQKQEQKQYELAYNFFLIKQQEEEKIKKICGVSSLSEIVNNSLQSDFENLELIKKQIESSISEIKKQNQAIKEQISAILTGKQQYTQQNLLKAEEEYVNSEKQLKNMEINSQKKYLNMNEWQAAIQLMVGQKSVTRDKLGERFKQIVNELSTYRKDMSKKRYSDNNINQSMHQRQAGDSKFKKLKQEQQSECSLLESNAF